MQIAIDFKYRVTVEDLDTSERHVYLVPRGTHSFMEDPEGRVAGRLGTPSEDELPPPPDVSGSMNAVSPVRANRLNPGVIGEKLSPKDAYGVPEG